MYSRIIRIGLSYRSRTGGGGAHTIGNVEARRHGAKEFLVKIILNFSTGTLDYSSTVVEIEQVFGFRLSFPLSLLLSLAALFVGVP